MISPVSVQENINGTLQDLVSISDIVDFGTNSNGNYVRFTNGLQLCWEILSTTQVNTLMRQALWTFPAEFYDTNISVVCNTRLTGSSHMAYVAYDINITTTNAGITFYAVSGNIPPTQLATSIAIGCWK